MFNFFMRIAVQIFIASLLAWSVGLVTDELGLGEIGHSHKYAIAIQVIKPAIIFLVDFLLGAAAYAWWKGMRASALWVELGPICLLAIAMAWDSWATGWNGLIGEYFVWKYPGGEEPPLMIYLLTYPALGAFSYSLGALTSKLGRWSKPKEVSPTIES